MRGLKGLNRRVVVSAVLMFSAASGPVGAQSADDARTIAPAVQASSDAVVPPSFSNLFDFDFGDTTQQPAGPIPTPRHTGFKAMAKGLVSDVKHLPAKENLMWAGIGSGLALAVHPADDNVNEALVGSTTAHDIFKAGAVLGQFPTLITAAGTIYAFGRIKDEPRVSHIGMDLIRALAVSEGLTQALKFATQPRTAGSERPSILSLRSLCRHLCLRHGARAPFRLALCDPGVYVLVLRRHFPGRG